MHRRLFAILAFSCDLPDGMDYCPVQSPGRTTCAPLESPRNNGQIARCRRQDRKRLAAATCSSAYRSCTALLNSMPQGKPIGIDLLDRQASDGDVKTFTLAAGNSKNLVVGRQNHRRGAEKLAAFPELEQLVLENTAVTDKGLQGAAKTARAQAAQSPPHFANDRRRPGSGQGLAAVAVSFLVV